MATLEPGGIVGGRYALERTIGTGGMAMVWLAHDRLLDRKVAVKILAERYASDPDFIERFRREASAAAGLSHPNIVTVFDRGETDGSYYIVMEHLPGPDLKAILRERGRLDPRQAVDATLQVLSALAAAHKRNVIHRDIKPQNVLVSEDGNLKVTDFGIARAGDDAGMTEIGSVIGTAQYLSPEQARGEEVTTASDCYSAGILLYEMLTGRVPFDGDKPVAIAMRQINETPVAPRVILPTLTPQLNEIVMKALEKRPSSRYRTAEEFTQALLAVRPLLPEPVEASTQVLAAGQPAPTTRVLGPPTQATRINPHKPSMPPHQPKRRSRWPLVGALLALLAIAGAAFGIFFTDLGRSPSGLTIPTVAGQSEPDARATLIEAGFADGTITVERQNDVETAVDLAIGTDPPEGESVARDAEITLLISSGPAEGLVPRLVGLTYDVAAKQLVDQYGFEPKRVDEYNDDKPEGEVIRQSPGGGLPLRQGETVTLFVSKGPEPVVVPSLLLLSQSEAEDVLVGLGLEVRVETRQTDRRPPGTVVDQDPPRGTELAKGEVVTITVAEEPVPATIAMIDIVGNSADVAQQKLRQRGFSEASSSTRPSPEAVGTVIAQNPAPGTQVDPATVQVSIIVSSGPVDVPGDPTTTAPAP